MLVLKEEEMTLVCPNGHVFGKYCVRNANVDTYKGYNIMILQDTQKCNINFIVMFCPVQGCAV